MKVINIVYSKDKLTKKYIQKTNDNYQIETLYVNYHNKHIICFSSQVGCNLGCKFCYNGIKNNFKRNLTTSEIIDQIQNVLKDNKCSTKPILFSAMGIGEPLLNYDNILNTFNILNSTISSSKFALATSGVDLNNILRLANDIKQLKNFKLTISLHSAKGSIRKNIMPSSSNIKNLITTVQKFKDISQKEVEWNYVLFKDINDSVEDAISLYELLGTNEYIKINQFNHVDISPLEESLNTATFISTLKDKNMNVEYYITNGSDIDGACGQLVSS